MSNTSAEVFRLHADICKTLSHPKRLQILDVLQGDEMAAGDIVKSTGIAKANASQHLALMRNAGILVARRDGVNIYYRVTSPKVIQACRLMRDVLMEHNSRTERIFRSTRT